MRFRVYYIDSWKVEKTIVLEATDYWDAIKQAEKMFGKYERIEGADDEAKKDIDVKHWMSLYQDTEYNID